MEQTFGCLKGSSCVFTPIGHYRGTPETHKVRLLPKKREVMFIQRNFTQRAKNEKQFHLLHFSSLCRVCSKYTMLIYGVKVKNILFLSIFTCSQTFE